MERIVSGHVTCILVVMRGGCCMKNGIH
jgi:hypothetical protein